MDLEQYKYIYEDLRLQMKQFLPLPILLKITEKSTKKLQCLNLYSVADRRQFDLQIEQKNITQAIARLQQCIAQLKFKTENNLERDQQISILDQQFEAIKQKNIQTFDLLNRQEELLSEQIELAEFYLGDEKSSTMVQVTLNQPKIKEEDEFDEQILQNNDDNYVNDFEDYQKQPEDLEQQNYRAQHRIVQLKNQIEEIGRKIAKINSGKGKWLNSDHQDFIRIYNKCNGHNKKVIDEGIKILGMKNIEIIDHLEIYEDYLQLEKQKKLVSEQYRQIKLMQLIDKQDTQEKDDQIKEQKRKLKKDKDIQEQIRKKQLIREFKQKKKDQKNKMLQEKELEEAKMKKNKVGLSIQKKKAILDRNQQYIQQRQKKFKVTKQQLKKENLSKNKVKINIPKKCETIKE